MREKKTFKNLFYQGLYQLVKIVLPLISVPIVANSLGAEGVGEYAFSNSIVQYFIIVAALGVPLYGTKAIAEANTKSKLKETFWSIEIFSLILATFIFLVANIIGKLLNFNDIFFIQTLLILGTGLDVSWFFMGIEEFKKVSLLNLSSTLISFIMIITFVRNPTDLYIYCLILTSSIIAPQFLMWNGIKEKIDKFYLPSILQMFNHLIKSSVFFLPQIGIVIYTNLNKTILGVLSTNKSDVGILSNAVLITSAIISLISAVDTVMLPKISKMVLSGEKENTFRTVSKVLSIQLYFTIPIAIGLGAISGSMVPWFFGPTFVGMEKIITIVSFLIIVIPAGMTISKQYLIPNNRIKTYNKTIFSGAAISIILNLIFISSMGCVGAAVALVTSESVIFLMRLSDFQNKTSQRIDIKLILIQISVAFTMWIVLSKYLGQFESGLLLTFLQVIVGMIIYFGGTTVLKANPLVAVNLRE